MRTVRKIPIPRILMVAAFASVLVGRATAQTFRTVYNFSGGPQPWKHLILSGDTLYGTTSGGGDFSSGSVFAITTAGGGFTNLHNFNVTDGSDPAGGLLLWSNTLYGTTGRGGASFSGTIFRVGTDGTGFTVLHSFDGTDGWGPSGRLALSGGRIFGTTDSGGGYTNGNGTVFAINIDGTGFKNLHNFAGADPDAPLGVVLSGDTLYGITEGDFISGSAGGTVFKLNVDGSGFSPLYYLGEYDFATVGPILSGNTLYGMAGGTVFKLNTDGTGFSPLGATAGDSGLILSGDAIYGTSINGGPSGNGFIFTVKTDGTGFSILYSFTALQTNSSGVYVNPDGAYPCWGAELALAGNTLYGTCELGGSAGYGTIFSISMPPQLTLTTTGQNLVLSWPTNFTGYTLRSTTNLGPSAVWITNLPAASVVNGMNTVTNPISGAQQFFRLSQ
jgi:uncharacterized repeat protein (TIGR03803 family)